MTFKRKHITYRNYQLATYSQGSAKNGSLIMIHGGPGTGASSLIETHGRLSKLGLQIITWDQLGCGDSSQPDDDTLWTLPRFVEEIECVRKAYGLQSFYLLGRSWGGLMAVQYALTHTKKIKRLILSSTTADIPLMQMGMQRCKMALGSETVSMMARREADHSTQHPEYQAALQLILRRHLCRLETWPAALTQAVTNYSKRPLELIFGRHLFNCTGNIRHFDCTDQLHAIKAPTLILQGEHDYISLECGMLLRDYLPHAHLTVLKNCSHMPFYEAPKIYFAEIEAFIQKDLPCVHNT